MQYCNGSQIIRNEESMEPVQKISVPVDLIQAMINIISKQPYEQVFQVLDAIRKIGAEATQKKEGE